MESALLFFSENNLWCDWDYFEIPSLLWLVIIDWNEITLFWDSQMNEEVVYKYIEC